MSKAYEIFVSYHYIRGDIRGFGNMKVTVEKKLDSYDVVFAIQEFIAKELGFDNVVVMYWQVLKRSHV